MEPSDFLREMLSPVLKASGQPRAAGRRSRDRPRASFCEAVSAPSSSISTAIREASFALAGELRARDERRQTAHHRA